VKLLQQAAGIDKLRITGGEPQVTPKFDDFLLGVMQRPMNVSLNPLRFQQIARGGDLSTVLGGIDGLLRMASGSTG